MPNGGMPNGENDVLQAKCRTSLGAMPNGCNAERAECRKLNSTKHMLCVTLLVTFVRTVSSFINLWCAAHIHNFRSCISHQLIFFGPSFSGGANAEPPATAGVMFTSGLLILNWSVDLWSLEGQSSDEQRNNGKRYAPLSPLCPNCMEFIHRTRRPFRPIAACPGRNFCSRCCRRHWDRQAPQSLQLRHLPQAATCLSTKCDVNDGSSKSWLRTTVLLWTRNIMPQNFLQDVHQHDRSQYSVVTWFFASNTLSFLIPPVSAFRPKSGSSCRHSAFRHSALSAFRPPPSATPAGIRVSVTSALATTQKTAVIHANSGTLNSKAKSSIRSLPYNTWLFTKYSICLQKVLNYMFCLSDFVYITLRCC